ncbi:HalOD1 output domain-containing protein [Halomarina litorea]|uniref:HalOD1 output domain-containing protein n=1 Tax=Halomarina litorea TaxID=2961595 RepID=UPI0020C595CD|nr:HalOD1 output domain-containing protein [Halomarina sp. BCD28]
MAIHPKDGPPGEEERPRTGGGDGPAVVHCDLGAVDEPSASVVKAVATAVAVDPLDLLGPLSDTVDPDALNDLFVPERSVAECVRFAFAGTTVEVRSDGRVTASPHRSE